MSGPVGSAPIRDPGTAQDHPIVFFDGTCGLCNRFVDLALLADRHGVVRFAPLQGETARRLLPPLTGDPSTWSVVYLDERAVHLGSDAALALARRIGGWLRVLSWLRVVPRSLRDPVYRWVARHRYRWFGRRDGCRVPSAAERARFLD